VASGLFKQFDLLEGKLPRGSPAKLYAVVQRARAILLGRTTKQVSAAAEAIDWFIEEYFEAEKTSFIRRILEHGGWELGYLDYEYRTEAGLRDLLDNWSSEEDQQPPEYPNRYNTSKFDALVACIDNYAIGNDSELPGAKLHEYFAVLALWKVADCIRSLDPPEKMRRFRKIADQFPSELDKLIPEPVFLTTQEQAVTDLCEALESICWAEHLQDTAALQEQIQLLHGELEESGRQGEEKAAEIARHRISVTASKAAIKRHAEHYAMKEDVWDWCEDNLHNYKSMEKAAEAVIHTYKLVPVSVRTARDWIREHVKLLQNYPH
tara:strand:+ start:1593 stop:2558 length:966 start_codon:yes stop_codon:yes gene_type:complete